MKNSSTLIAGFSIITLTLLSVTLGYTNPCAVGTLRYSVLTEQTESVLSVAFHPIHNDILAVGRADGTIRLWNISKSEAPLHTLTEHTDIIFTLAFSADGNILASGSADGTVRLWNTTHIENRASIEELWDPFTGHTDIVLSLAFSANGKTLASGSRDGTIWLWNLSDLDKIEQHNIFAGYTLPAVLSLAFSMEGNKLATGRADGTIRVWDLADGELLYTFTDPTDPVLSLAFSSDDNTLASGSADSTVRLWDTSASIGTNKPLHEFSEHEDWVNSVAFYKTTLASAGFDNVIHLWEVSTKNLLHELTGHADSIESVAFSRDGNTLASGGHDGKVLLWELTPPQIEADVNGDGFVNLVDLTLVDSRLGMTGQNTADVDGDGIINITDLVMVAKIMADVNGDEVVDFDDLKAVDANFGMTGQNTADINADNIVNITDLVMVANAICPTAAAAPSAYKHVGALLTTKQVQEWLNEARLSEEKSPIYQRGILVLEQLMAMSSPKQTSLQANYPNPFNPETWIPYQLAASANVTVSIYSVDRKLVRTLELGHQPAGNYQTKHRAASWDGRNNFGERVASGVYFYALTADNFTATRKMLIQK